MTHAPAKTFSLAQTVFNGIVFAAETPLLIPALDVTKPPVEIANRIGIPDHEAFKELVNLLARPKKYDVPTRWNRTGEVKTEFWDERHEDSCDVTLGVGGILNKGDMLAIALDGQVGCAEVVYRSIKPLFAVGQFIAAEPYCIASVALCAGVDVLRMVGRNTKDARGKIWNALAKHLTEKMVVEGIDDKLTPLLVGAETLSQRSKTTSNGTSIIYHSGRESDSYDPGARLGFTYPFIAEYHPHHTRSDLFTRILRERTITIKHDIRLNQRGKQPEHVLAIREFMAAVAARQPSLFSDNAK